MDDSAATPSNDDHSTVLNSSGRGNSDMYPAAAGHSPDSAPMRGGGTSNAVNGDTSTSTTDESNEIDFDWPELPSLHDVDTDLRNFESAFVVASCRYSGGPTWSPDVQLVYLDEPNWSTSNAVNGDSGTTTNVSSGGGGRTCRLQARNQDKDATSSGANAGMEDEHEINEIDFGWPDLGGLQDLDTDLRNLESAFVIGSNCSDDPVWSPDVELGHCFDKPNSSTTGPEGSAENPILVLEPTVSDPVIAHQQPSRNNGAPLAHASSSSSWEDFPSRKKSRGATPDMVLDKMAKNPLEMYFPPLTATCYRQRPPMNVTSSAQRQRLPPMARGCFAVAGDGVAADGSSAGSCERPPRWSPAPEALPVQFLAFQKLQEGGHRRAGRRD